MTTYTQILYQIVFATRNREKVLNKENRELLFQYIAGIIEKKDSHLYRINGVNDHIHIATHLNPKIALSSFVKDIKLATTDFIKRNNLFPGFQGWQEGYGAFTYTLNEKENLIQYIIDQEVHHKSISFEDEYRKLLIEHHIQYNEKYLF